MGEKSSEMKRVNVIFRLISLLYAWVHISIRDVRGICFLCFVSPAND